MKLSFSLFVMAGMMRSGSGTYLPPYTGGGQCQNPITTAEDCQLAWAQYQTSALKSYDSNGFEMFGGVAFPEGCVAIDHTVWGGNKVHIYFMTSGSSGQCGVKDGIPSTSVQCLCREPPPPTNAPTDAPTNAPTDAPTNAPTDAPTNAPTDAPTNAPTALGRFEVAHREASGQVGSLVKMEPLSVDVFFKVGSSIPDNTNLSLQVYGTLDVDATKACDEGVDLATASQLTRRLGALNAASEGTASFDLDLTKLAANFKAYNGAKVDVCARVKYENTINDNTIQTFVDTRIVIDRTYTADLTGNAVTIADPSSGKFNKADETTVAVTEFFCNADKSQLGSTGLTFGPGQDIRICVEPTQDTDTNNLFEYKVSDFTGVKCSFVGATTAVEFDINFDGTFNKKETPNASGTGSFVFVLLNTDLARSPIRQLQCTGKAVISSDRKRRLSSGSSSDNGLVRSLQETPEDVETPFSIGLTITDEDSGVSSVSVTAFALAGGSLAAALL